MADAAQKLISFVFSLQDNCCIKSSIVTEQTRGTAAVLNDTDDDSNDEDVT